ncbi:MAG: alpha-amylase family glycosyl hydrolase [Pacificimonas sp.]
MKIPAALLALMLALPALAQRPPLAERTEADYAPQPYVELVNAPWTKDAVIYQLNTRQFTKEGTFRAAMADLPRLHDMGVDIVWLMPIHPIGERNRKGSLGSPYSVRDYFGVNPELGTEDDFRAFVTAAHDLGLKVILDWVANHTAWDNPLLAAHPDWYERDWKGDNRPTPWWDWSDIIDLDYRQPGVRKYMTEALAYWVRTFDIDGYRADVAGYVPVDFWEDAREDLDAIKPVFMLAEWKEPELHRRAFDATYSWEWYRTLERIAKGDADATALYGYYSENESAWPMEAMRMVFTSNHDINSWDAPAPEVFGDALPAITVLQFVTEGIPLIYNGQEVCNAKKLEFFERDPIDWSQNCEGTDLDRLYRDLISFRDANPALHNGRWGARMTKVENSAPEQILSFVRARDGNRVFAIFNLSPVETEVSFPAALAHGRFQMFRTGEVQEISEDVSMSLPPWGFRLLTSKAK